MRFYFQTALRVWRIFEKNEGIQLPYEMSDVELRFYNGNSNYVSE